MLINAFSDHYHNVDGIEGKKSTNQIIIWGYCSVVQSEYSKITDTKLFLFQGYP